MPGCTSSWNRDGIQFNDEDQKKGSMLYLVESELVLAWNSATVPNRTYFAPSICNIGPERFSRKSARTRSPLGLFGKQCEHHWIVFDGIQTNRLVDQTIPDSVLLPMLRNYLPWICEEAIGIHVDLMANTRTILRIVLDGTHDLAFDHLPCSPVRKTGLWVSPPASSTVDVVTKLRDRWEGTFELFWVNLCTIHVS